MCGCFYWVSFVGGFITSALVVGVYIRAPNFWKLPRGTAHEPRQQLGVLKMRVLSIFLEKARISVS